MEKSQLSNNQNLRYCLECGSEMKQFFLPVDDYENQFCERCELDDYEGKCHCT